jgi:type I restriction enzyme S subunit
MKLGNYIKLISGQHIDAANCNTVNLGTPYLTGPADFIGKTPGTSRFTNQPKVCCEKGDILITVKGAGTGSIAIADQKYCISRQLMAIRCERIDPIFTQYLVEINGKKFNSSAAGLIPGISRSDVLGVNVPSIPLAEQVVIAVLLSAWDTAIEKTERLIAAKGKRYAHLVSSLIANNRHHRGHIHDFTTEVSKRNNGTAIVRVLSVTNNRGFVLPEDHFERRVASSDLSNYKIVTSGQYAYNPSRINVGSIARLDGWDSGVLSPMYVVFEIDDKKVNSDFFLHWLSSHEAKGRIRRSAQGSVRETVSFTDLGAISFPMPLLDKQIEVTSILNITRKEIDLLRKQLEAYRKQKRGLMQKLLTGKWRIMEGINKH